MTVFRLFSVLFSSFWLAAFYVGKLKKQRPDQGAFKYLLDSLIHGPRLWQAGEVQHHSGFCYVIKLDRPFLSEQMGKSNLVLLEDGKNLPLPHTRNIQDIIDQGQGRYLHVQDNIYFSPPDNASPELVKQRQYVLLETLSTDSHTVEQLLTLNKRRDSYKNDLLFSLEKIRCYLEDKISFTALSEPDSASLRVHMLSLNLMQWQMGNWIIDRSSISLHEQSTEKRLSAVLEDISVQGLSEKANIDLDIGISKDLSIRIYKLQLTINKQKYLQLDCDWNNEALQNAHINFFSLSSLRQQLTASVGGDEQEYTKWLRGFFYQWAQTDMGLPWMMGKDTAEKIIAVLSPVSTAQTLALSLVDTDNGQGLQLKLADNFASEVS